PLRLRDALLRESHVDPSGEEVLLVPFGVAVAEQDERRRHALQPTEVGWSANAVAPDPARQSSRALRGNRCSVWREMARARRPEGRITRGTTGVNRLRRVDRWIAALPVLRATDDPLVVDLGYGASATTSNELHDRLAKVRGDVEVLGIEIDPERVRRAAADAKPGVSFRLGGFEVPTDGGRRPAVIRALNVLRQYDESEVPDAWARMRARLAPGGQLVEGTCNELGRVASWVTLDADGPHK